MYTKSKIKKVVILIILSITLTFGCLVAVFYIFLKNHTVYFKDAQVERMVRLELNRIDYMDEDKKIMTWDIDKITELCFGEFDENEPSPEDISDLIKLHNLKTLSFHSLNSKTNLDILKGLPKLTFLSIYKKVEKNGQGEWVKIPLNNVDFLKGATKLEQIILIDCGLKDISGLENMSTLTSLEIDSNQIEDISVLATLPNLVDLSASQNKINDISVLEDISSLKYANLADNPVEKDNEYKELWKVLNKRRVKEGLDKVALEELY